MTSRFENGILCEVYAKAVPKLVDDEGFWFRYFYRLIRLSELRKLGRSCEAGGFVRMMMRIGNWLNRKLTSWKSLSDPSMGDFVYELDRRGLLEMVLQTDRRSCSDRAVE
ncbi:hypothetical protein Scep_020607 [Stephania cephalantha]|uniref:BSD domain-containing protein n=1 Tax=Stephania cephalantha TaxID=152367 RepID=A0AAP0IDG9_9MAGN